MISIQTFKMPAGLRFYSGRLMVMITLLFAWSNSFSQTYCTPTVANNGAYNIGTTNVQLGTINNSSAAQTGFNPYSDYTNLYTVSTAGSTINFSLTAGGTANPTRTFIYIDWDRNGVFNSSNEVAYASGTLAPGSVTTGTISIPSGLTPSPYRVRVSSDFYPYNPVSPCNTAYGEHEDYTLVIINSSAGDDAGAFRITPALFTAGTHNISLNWYNLGTTTITSADLGYQLDNNTAVTETFSGSVASGANTTHNFSTAASVSVGDHVLKVWVRNPNSTYPDLSPGNDTIIFSFCTALSGSYTIDPGGSGASNFTSFNSALAKLYSCGIAGPIIFRVAAGTYNEKVTIGTILGVSSTNTITFDGGSGNASTRILTYSGGSNNINCYTLQLNNSPWVRLRNLTIRNGNSNYGIAVHVFGNSSNTIISNCIVEFVGNGLTSNAWNQYKAILVDASDDVTNSGQCGGTGTGITNVLIDSNIINGGFHGVRVVGTGQSTNMVVSHNTITNAYEFGVVWTGTNGWTTNYNKITMRASNPYS